MTAPKFTLLAAATAVLDGEMVLPAAVVWMLPAVWRLLLAFPEGATGVVVALVAGPVVLEVALVDED